MQVTTHVPALVEVCFAISGLTDPDLHPAIINTHRSLRALSLCDSRWRK